MAPVKAGDRVGEIRIIVEGETVATVPVETAAAVAENRSMWNRALDSLLIMAFGS
jgi:hypothetical protein